MVAETWLEEKMMDDERDKINVKLGINQLRINFYDKYYYISKTDESVMAYKEEDVTFFVEKINSIQRTKPNRKTRRANTKMYKKMMSQIKRNSKNNAEKVSNEISEKISNEMINNPESTLDEIKSETKDNLKKVFNKDEEAGDNNGQ